MSIAKNTKRRKSLPASATKYPDGYVLPARELQSLFEATRHDQIEPVAARLQLIADLTSKSVGGKLAQTNLQRLQQIVAEASRTSQQRLLDAILRAVEEGGAGLIAARQTAAHLVEQYFLFSRERYLALKLYEDRLRHSHQ